MKADTVIRKITPVRGYCGCCKQSVRLEYYDRDTSQSLCNECAGHLAVAEFWLRRNGIWPCTKQYQDRGGTSLLT